MILLLLTLSIKKVMSRRFYCVNKTRVVEAWLRTGAGREITGPNVRTSFFILCFRLCLGSQRWLPKRERDKIISKEGGNYKLDLSLMSYIKMKIPVIGGVCAATRAAFVFVGLK